jgi:hypothetical protein
MQFQFNQSFTVKAQGIWGLLAGGSGEEFRTPGPQPEAARPRPAPGHRVQNFSFFVKIIIYTFVLLSFDTNRKKSKSNISEKLTDAKYPC